MTKIRFSIFVKNVEGRNVRKSLFFLPFISNRTQGQSWAWKWTIYEWTIVRSILSAPSLNPLFLSLNLLLLSIHNELSSNCRVYNSIVARINNLHGIIRGHSWKHKYIILYNPIRSIQLICRNVSNDNHNYK